MRFILLVFSLLVFIESKAQPLCRELFTATNTRESNIGFDPLVRQMDLSFNHTIKNVENYLNENLGPVFTQALKSHSPKFVVIALGDGPDGLRSASEAGYRFEEKVQKAVGFHQIRHATDSNGNKGFVIYRVNGRDREIHIQSFLKWFNFPESRVHTIGKSRDWAPDLEQFFHELGPAPDLVVYGFAEAAALGLLKAHPVANLPVLWRAYKALKPHREPLSDEQSDLQGRPVQLITLRNGKRIWLFKNMYGQLAGDLMRALSNYGARSFLSLGTAGSLSDRLPVGTVFTPAFQGNGTDDFAPINVLYPLKGVPVTGRYEKVDTPNIETKNWLHASTARGLETVEVELGYLLKWAQENPKVRLSAALVISDILVGESHRDMTEWGSDDLSPLRSRFTDLISQGLGIFSPRDLIIRDYQVKRFTSKTRSEQAKLQTMSSVPHVPSKYDSATVIAYRFSPEGLDHIKSLYHQLPVPKIIQDILSGKDTDSSKLRSETPTFFKWNDAKDTFLTVNPKYTSADTVIRAVQTSTVGKLKTQPDGLAFITWYVHPNLLRPELIVASLARSRIGSVEAGGPKYLVSILDLDSTDIIRLEALKKMANDYVQNQLGANPESDQIRLDFHFPYSIETATLHLHIRVNKPAHPLDLAKSYSIDEILSYLKAGKSVKQLILDRQSILGQFYFSNDSRTILESIPGGQISHVSNPFLEGSQDGARDE